ncbi:MAG: cadherin-like beta sandwich domain-containing protein [Candidatus Hydrogenedentes bacterium]|nr:cadherin-like beta sandwich domain-containing protein [Candidatus Hydrogenedentota bacterium]
MALAKDGHFHPEPGTVMLRESDSSTMVLEDRMTYSHWLSRAGLTVLAFFMPHIAYGESTPMTNDATLTSLSVDPGAISPGFSPNRTGYTVHVPNAVTTLTITATPNDLHATLVVNGAPAALGQPSAPIPIEPGRTLIPIVVTAADGQTKSTYTLKAFRAYLTPSWVRVTASAPFAPRDSAGELVFNGRMWLFGGYTPDVINDVWSSEDGANWTRVGEIPNMSGVNIPVNFVYNGKMWVVCNDGSLYSSPNGADWLLVTDQAPWRGRYAMGGAVFAGKMWVMGGMKSGALFNDVWSSTDGVRWDLETANAPWSKRQLFSLVTEFGGGLWVLGGGITLYHPFKAYNDIWRSPNGRDWTKVTDEAPWPGRIWTTSAVYRNRLWVFGGFRAEPVWTNLNDVWYSSDGAHWNELAAPTVWLPRHELSAYVFKDKLWVVAGNGWPLVNDVWCLDIPGLTFLTQPVIEEFVTAEYTYRSRADFNKSGGEIHYRLINSPAWLTVDARTGVVRGAPQDTGEFPVAIEAFDDTGETARQTFTLYVIPAA